MDDSPYQQSILALARIADEAGRLDCPHATATVDTPVCGDRVTLDVAVDGVAVAAIGHKVRGCVLCKASAAVIGRHAPGQSADALRGLAARFEAMIRHGEPAPDAWPDLAAFVPVRSVRSRHECVLLPFTALIEALTEAGL